MEKWFEIDANGMDLARSVSCAQAFRWREHEQNCWFGAAQDKAVFARQQEGKLLLSCAQEDEPFWRHYFALDLDYAQMERMLEQDPLTSPCLETSRGIRVFRQQPFETLISFIISANNNFQRICGIVEKLCQAFGEERSHCGQRYHTFPDCQALANASEVQLKNIGTGYRAPYIIGSAQKIAKGYDLDALRYMPFDKAKKELLTFPGVGPKVAECTMLFSLGFDEAFPVDVWVARVSKELYPNQDVKQAAQSAAARFGRWAGAAQQYLFHYARQVKLGRKYDTLHTEISQGNDTPHVL